MAAARYRDRVPTLQDFTNKDFEIKQINDNISRANTKIKKVQREIKQLKKTKKKYNHSKKTKDITKNYFLALDTGMDEDDFNSIFDDQGGISGMFSLLNSKMDDKIRKKEREIGTLTNYIEELNRKKVNVIQYRERTASQAAQKAAQDAIVPEAIKAVEKFDNQLSKFQNYSGRKLTLKEKYNNQIDATLRMWSLGNDRAKKQLTKDDLNQRINQLYESLMRGEFDFQPRNSNLCWKNLETKLRKPPLSLDKTDYPNVIIPLIYKTLIFSIPFIRKAITLKSQAKIRTNQLPDVIESEAPEDIKNLKLSFDYLKAELQNINSNIEMFHSKLFLECMITKQDILKIPRSLQIILNSIITNFPVETNIEDVWLEITNLDEKIKKMEKITREMSEFYNRKSTDEIMAKDAAKAINSWRMGSGVRPLAPEQIRELQRQMYKNAGKPLPKWLKPKKSNARTRAKKAAKDARKTATQRLKGFFGKRRGGRRKKTRKKKQKKTRRK